MKKYNMAKLFRSLKIQALFIFLFISAFVISTWFSGSFIYGGAEVGLFTYNPQRWFQISGYVWWDAVSPGQIIPHFITAQPLYFYFYILHLIGLSAQNIQQFIFFILLFLMGFGMFLLTFNIFDENKKKYALVAGLFYMFNAYTLIQVWHRFLYVNMFLAAVLPFLILFWRKWIKEGKLGYLTAFLLINFLSVYMYGNLAAVATVWFALSLLSVAEIIFPWQGRSNLKKISFRFLMGLIFWFLTNIWWITPTFSIGPGLLSAQHSSEDNLGTLVMISRQTIMPYLLQLVNPYYLFYQSELGLIYSNTFFKIMAWIISVVVFAGLIFGLRSKNYAKYSVIFLISVLFAKGAAAPFAYPYIFGFEYFYFLGVLRNPFEKLGIMLAIFGAILFAVGLQKLYKPVAVLVLVVLIGFAWPMFGGKIFGTKNLPVKVSIPESYKEADRWFKQQNENQGVILHLPFSGKDVVTYDWNKGYHGVDQNEILFSSLTSLSRSIGIKRVDDTLGGLTYIFTPPFAKDKKQILKILQNFNVKYIVLHKDIIWQDKDTYGDIGGLLKPEVIESVLDNLDFLKRERQFGQLVIYRLTDENYKQILRLTDDFQIIYPGGSNIMQIISLTNNNADLITPVSKKVDELALERAKQILIFPDKKIDYFESSPSAMVAKTNEIFNQLLQIREYFYSLGELQSEQITKDLILSTEKVSKLSSSEQVLEYEELMKKIFKEYSPNLNIHRLFNSQIAYILRWHLFVLNKIGAKPDIIKLIEDDAVKLELLPQYKNYGQVFKFTVPSKGDYELLAPDPGSGAEIRVNGESIVFKNHVVANKGDYEISYPVSNLPEGDIALKLKGIDDQLLSKGSVINFQRISPVLYSGTVVFDQPAFLLFAQTYHPDWILTLTKGGKSYRVDDHLMSNLYGNAWWVKEAGQYNFSIEFTHQRNVEKGIILAISASVFLILTQFYFQRKGTIKK